MLRYVRDCRVQHSSWTVIAIGSGAFALGHTADLVYLDIDLQVKVAVAPDVGFAAGQRLAALARGRNRPPC